MAAVAPAAIRPPLRRNARRDPLCSLLLLSPEKIIGGSYSIRTISDDQLRPQQRRKLSRHGMTDCPLGSVYAGRFGTPITPPRQFVPQEVHSSGQPPHQCWHALGACSTAL